jgi:ribonuclease J
LEPTVRVTPIGGLEEIGRNMCCFEYGDEIIILDAGIQFPEEETPGIDFIIPNVQSLEGKKDKIKALILSHAHFDHIGAIPYIIEKIGNPIIYTTNLTRGIVEKRQADFPNAPKLKFHVVKRGDKVKISPNFEAEFFNVDHTVPDTVGIILKTPIGNLVHYADFRVDSDEKGNFIDVSDFERIGKMGVHTLFIDSTNADEEGYSVSEKIVEKNLEKLFREADGRIILSTFSSMISRLDEIIQIAQRLGRKVAIAGRSMKENIQISQDMGYMKVAKGTIINLEDIRNYKDHQILILATGAQGQENAALMRIVNGEHRQVRIKAGDSVVFSSSVIPGNERSVQNVKDSLARQGAIVHQSKHIDIHASGHAPADELKMVMEMTKPRFLVPVHGHYFKRAANCQTGQSAGIPKENTILMDNGQVAELTKDSFTITNERVPAYYVMVDGLGVGDVEEVVLRDRRVLAQEGMVVIIATLSRNSGRVLKNPDIISRGFIYLKEQKELLDEVRKKIRSIISRIPRQHLDGDYVKTLIRDQVGQFLYSKTKRRPMVLPVVIEI